MASNHNQLFLKLIKEIEKGDITGETIKSISREKLWKELLEFMKEEGGSDNLGHYPIFQSDFKADSLFKYINATADMDSTEAPAGTYDFKKILDNLKSITNPDGTANTGSGNSPWNESLTNSLTYFLRYIDPEYVANYEKSHSLAYTTDKDKETGRPLDVVNTNGSIPVKDVKLKGGFRIDDVKNANAGNSFSKTSVRPWVKPNYDVDGETYDKVRGIDKILKVLASHKEMQFTRTQNQTEAESVVNKYIRLLMPKYLRRVEVEDLNRNFWVIGQVIAAISAYLFDEDSPIVKTFRNILNELVQLWENVLYLWATAMLLSQKPYYTKVHTEVVYVPNDSYRDYSKFDDFQNTKLTTLSDIWTKRLSYLKDSYPECHLCILPVVRDNNYRHNYYGKETWPGVILYNRNLDIMEYRSFTSNNVFTINDELAKRMYCIHEDEDTFRYYAPYTNVKTSDTGNKLTEELSYRYTAALRVRPTAIAITFNADDNNFTYTGVTLALDDAIGTAVTGSVKNIAQVSFGPSLAGTITYKQTPYTGTPVNNSVSKESIEKKIEELKQGYYLGELISDGNVSEEFTYDIQAQNIVLRPIIPNYGDMTSSGLNAIKAEDKKIFTQLSKELEDSDTKQITLITGRHFASLLKKYNDLPQYQQMGNNAPIYVLDGQDKVHKFEKGQYKYNTEPWPKEDAKITKAFTSNGTLDGIIVKGPQPGDQHFYDIMGAKGTSGSPYLVTDADEFKHGTIYQIYHNNNYSLEKIQKEKEKYLESCRFTTYQEIASLGATLKFGNQTKTYDNYEVFENNLPRWSEVKVFLKDKNKYQLPDLCETLARAANISIDDENNKVSVSVGRMGAETITNKFYYKSEDGKMKKDNWLIQQVRVFYTFGPTLNDNIGDSTTLSKDYSTLNYENWTYKEELSNVPVRIGYKNPKKGGGFVAKDTEQGWHNYCEATYENTNGQGIINVKYNYDLMTKEKYKSDYAPYGLYGWPVTSTALEEALRKKENTATSITPYWDTSGTSEITVTNTANLHNFLSRKDSTYKNRVYISDSGMQLYPGWPVKIVISYFYPNKLDQHTYYRLTNDYKYPSLNNGKNIKTWYYDTDNQKSLAVDNDTEYSRLAEPLNDYTFFKASGNFVRHTDNLVAIDFSKNFNTGIYRP